MAKTIDFKFEGAGYTLEFTRGSVATLEKQGFVIGDIEDKPVTTLPALFAGAFLAHHRFIKKEVVDRIFAQMTNKEDLILKLAEMYNEPIVTMVDEPEENEGNVQWGASW